MNILVLVICRNLNAVDNMDFFSLCGILKLIQPFDGIMIRKRNRAKAYPNSFIYKLFGRFRAVRKGRMRMQITNFDLCIHPISPAISYSKYIRNQNASSTKKRGLSTLSFKNVSALQTMDSVFEKRDRNCTGTCMRSDNAADGGIANRIQPLIPYMLAVINILKKQRIGKAGITQKHGF